ncbi:MAG: 50S ribosomal protein L10 [Eubacteriales bacterium]|nr:50S ribosomal protein L10 [Eubacteriales bacterium]
MPSPKVLAEKQEIVKQLASEFKSAQTMVLAEYRGLTVEQDTELRAEMRKGGVTYKVIKNTLGRLAAKEAGFDELESLFVGPTAIAFSDQDPVGPAKILKKFADKYEPLTMKGGATDGRVMALTELEALANVPDIEVLYAQVVGGLSSPIRGLACYLKAIADKCEEQGCETAAGVYEGPKSSDETSEAEAAAPEASAEENSVEEA